MAQATVRKAVQAGSIPAPASVARLRPSDPKIADGRSSNCAPNAAGPLIRARVCSCAEKPRSGRSDHHRGFPPERVEIVQSLAPRSVPQRSVARLPTSKDRATGRSPGAEIFRAAQPLSEPTHGLQAVPRSRRKTSHANTDAASPAAATIIPGSPLAPPRIEDAVWRNGP